MAPINGRRWAFTINNFTSVEEPESWDKDKVLFCFWQHESGEAGTPHLQGVVTLARASRLTALKKIHSSAHWTLCNGNLEQNIAYCSKEDSRIGGPWEYGDRSAQGKRSDLLRLKDAVEEGRTELNIAEDENLHSAWAKYFRATERYKRLRSAKARNWATFTTILWGPPGTGKTRHAHDSHPDAYWLKKPGKGQSIFFDGYEGQETVIIDEYYGWLPYDLLCRMCDRYPLMVDTKGGMCNFYPKNIVITSNKDPHLWYKDGLQALERRFTQPLGQIHFCGAGWVPEPMEEISIIASANAQLAEVDSNIPLVPPVKSPILNMFGHHRGDCACPSCGPITDVGHGRDCGCDTCTTCRKYILLQTDEVLQPSPPSSPRLWKRRCSDLVAMASTSPRRIVVDEDYSVSSPCGNSGP